MLKQPPFLAKLALLEHLPGITNGKIKIKVVFYKASRVHAITCSFLLLRNCEVGGKRVQTQRCNLPSPTPCVFVACIRSRSGRSSIAPFPMQNIVAKTTQQRTIARADVSLVLTLTAVSCSLFIVFRVLESTGVRELVLVLSCLGLVLVFSRSWSWSWSCLGYVMSCLDLGLGLGLGPVLSRSCLGLGLGLVLSYLGLVLP